MYHKEPRWLHDPIDVFRKVGTPELPSRPLIEYSLSTPGLHTLIIGIGQIDDNPMKCQLIQNFYSAQIKPNGMPDNERKRIEEQATLIKPKSNYFQMEKVGLTAPGNLRKEGNKIVWDTALAGDFAIKTYEVLINGKKAGEVKHQPQTLKSKPFAFEASIKSGDKVEVFAVDQSGGRVVAQLA